MTHAYVATAGYADKALSPQCFRGLSALPFLPKQTLLTVLTGGIYAPKSATAAAFEPLAQGYQGPFRHGTQVPFTV